MNIDKLIKPLFDERKTTVLITMFLVFYGGYASPELPEPVLNLFENPVFRIFILSLIVYKSNSNPTLSILISILFVNLMNSVNKKKLLENFSQENSSGDIIEHFSLPEPEVITSPFRINGFNIRSGFSLGCIERWSRYTWDQGKALHGNMGYLIKPPERVPGGFGNLSLSNIGPNGINYGFALKDHHTWKKYLGGMGTPGNPKKRHYKNCPNIQINGLNFAWGEDDF